MFAVANSSRSVLRAAALRGVPVSSTRLASTSTMHENDPDVLELEKSRNLSDMQRKFSPHENAPGWNEKLASASEAAVKADRSSGSTEQLVSNTMSYMRARDETESTGSNTMASYSRDEVHGPLKGVGKEEVTFEQDVVLDSEGKNHVKKEIKFTHGAKVKEEA